MCIRKISLLTVSISFICNLAFSQQQIAPKDSTLLYKKIETYSKHRKFTQWVYSLVFKPVEANPKKKKVYKKLIIKPYSSFEGKIIRHIKIVTLDPFGFSITDTIEAPTKLLAKTGNNLHIKTLSITIRNLLLIKENRIFDSFMVKESERLIRSREYVRDVSFFVIPALTSPDSVDISIRVLDIWSIIPDGSFSASHRSIGLTDQNFLGMGHSFQSQFARDYKNGINSYTTNYTIPNFKNSYIGARFHFDLVEQANYSRQFAIDRPFFSPYAKWAAGISMTQEYRLDSIMLSSLNSVPQKIKFNVQDYWAGNAIQLYKGNSEYVRTTNLISAIRLLRISYLEKPNLLLDPQNSYFNENLFLASIGISTRKYIQDKYIFKFGIIEDVPIGKVLSLTAGYQNRDKDSRPYLGGRLSFGDYRSWGYLSSNIEYGTFFEASKPRQGIISCGLIYFTGLLEVGKWKFRQFVKPQMAIGMNLLSQDTLTMTNAHGLAGFNVAGLSGRGRVLLTLQTQAYAPWNFIGFRFGPFLTMTFLSIIGDSSDQFSGSKLYSQIGLGLLIKNENLVLNTFQISFAFYPLLPGNGQNVFKSNSFRTTDLGFKDFEIGKPGIVTFQ